MVNFLFINFLDMSRTGIFEKFVYLIGMKLTVSSFNTYKKLVIGRALESFDRKQWMIKAREAVQKEHAEYSSKGR